MPWEPLPAGNSSEPKHLADGLDRVARSLGVPSAGALTRIFSEWERLVGSAVAANCWPVAIDGSRLTVAVDDPAWSTQLRLLEPVLVERIGELLESDVVTAIQVRVQPR